VPISSPDEITVAHGPLEGAFVRYVGGALIAFVGAAALLVGASGIWRHLSLPSGSFEVARYFVWALIGLGMLPVGYHLFRLRHAFTATYTVTESGIEVRECGEAATFVRWADIDVATARRLFSLIEIVTPVVSRPIALFHSVGQLQRYALLKEIFAQRLGAKFRLKIC
jgi:hypothetical protein